MALNGSDLDKRFAEAANRASATQIKFPPDILLHFYAYYKLATGEQSNEQVYQSSDRNALVGAFKMNALFQSRNLSPTQAKKKYIKMVERHIPE